MAAVANKEKMKTPLILFAIIVFLIIGNKNIVFAQSNNLALRCSDFLKVLPQSFVRDTSYSTGKQENSFLCSFWNKDKVSAGSESDVDITPYTVDIRGGKDAKEQYELAKKSELDDKYSGYKIIAEDTVGKKSYVAVRSGAVVSPTKDYDIKFGRTVFYQGSCYVRMEYFSRLNASVSNFHPYDKKLYRYQNLHPSFDHGVKRMEEEMERIAGNISSVCSSNKIIFNTEKSVSRDINEQSGNNSSRNSKPQSNSPEDFSRYSQALIIVPPKESDFRKVDKSDFKIVYPVSSNSASLKAATQSAGLAFMGKISSEGELLVELPNGETITLTDDYTGAEVEEARVVWRHNVKLLNVRFVRNVIEVDCHIQIAQSIRYQKELDSLGFVRKVPNYDLDSIRKTVGDCSDLEISGLMRIFVQKGPALLNIQNGSVLANQDADFGFFNDVNTGASTVEVYNGLVTIKNKSGQSKKLSAQYGSDIKRIEADKNGNMNEKIAIPQSEWESFLASQQKKEQEVNSGSNLPIVPAILALGIGGLIFFLYRTGKLLPLYKTLGQKVSSMTKKISKTGKEIEKN